MDFLWEDLFMQIKQQIAIKWNEMEWIRIEKASSTKKEIFFSGPWARLFRTLIRNSSTDWLAYFPSLHAAFVRRAKRESHAASCSPVYTHVWNLIAGKKAKSLPLLFLPLKATCSQLPTLSGSRDGIYLRPHIVSRFRSRPTHHDVHWAPSPLLHGRAV